MLGASAIYTLAKTDKETAKETIAISRLLFI